MQSIRTQAPSCFILHTCIYVYSRRYTPLVQHSCDSLRLLGMRVCVFVCLIRILRFVLHLLFVVYVCVSIGRVVAVAIRSTLSMSELFGDIKEAAHLESPSFICTPGELAAVIDTGTGLRGSVLSASRVRACSHRHFSPKFARIVAREHLPPMTARELFTLMILSEPQNVHSRMKFRFFFIFLLFYNYYFFQFRNSRR